MDLLSNTGNIVLIVVGFGLLIFVHEMGHFLAARWARIRCESFAIGMGPPILAYRPGVGWAFGSTDPACVRKFGKPALQMTDAELRANGVGETEYSVRVLPLGGFVRMLGQDDLNPSETSSDVRGFQRAPIWKRMIVISAGVTANVICALVLFVVAFMRGVPFEAPIIGAVEPGSPAALAKLMPGDTVVSIDDQPVLTFPDIQIAAAMGRAEVPQQIVVHRPGVAQPLELSITPKMNPALGMQYFGVDATHTTTLIVPLRSDADAFNALLASAGIDPAKVPPGSSLRTVNGQPVESAGALEAFVDAGNGQPLATMWKTPKEQDVAVELTPAPQFERLVLPRSAGQPEGARTFESGLAGMVPLIQVRAVKSDSPNASTLRAGDIFLRVGKSVAPTMGSLSKILGQNKDKKIPAQILRDGKEVDIEVTVSADGTVGIVHGSAWSVPLISAPIAELGLAEDPKAAAQPSAVASLELLPLSRITQIAGQPIANWIDMRTALQRATASNATSDKPTPVEVVWQMPTPGHEEARGTIAISAAEATQLHTLGWSFPLERGFFDVQNVTLQANGNLATALGMGFRQTGKMITMTYLTLDRLFRRTVSVDQLRGPVGIVHLGTIVADRGFMYLIFFLAAISINLAVLNFLPLPIVDGGLFLYLIYEKITGRQPSPAFQNVAMLVGLCLLGGIFVMTFYNDVMRLIR